MKIPNPVFYTKLIINKIRNWYDNLPTMEDDIVRQTCDSLRKVEPPFVRREVYRKLVEQYTKEKDKKMVKALEKHKAHLGIETIEDWK